MLNNLKPCDQNSVTYINLDRTTDAKHKFVENSESEVKSVDIGTDLHDKDYCVFVDISKVAKVQRALQWAGLKLVSSQVR